MDPVKIIFNSAAIGTAVGALPGVGSTLAATLGYASGRRMQERSGGTTFGSGAAEGVAATEAANSAVSGANLILVLSLGIPGNAAAVFLRLVPKKQFRQAPRTGRRPEGVRNLFDAPEAASVRRERESLLDRRPDDIEPIRTPVGIA